jgi:hypothetical protein
MNICRCVSAQKINVYVYITIDSTYYQRLEVSVAELSRYDIHTYVHNVANPYSETAGILRQSVKVISNGGSHCGPPNYPYVPFAVAHVQGRSPGPSPIANGPRIPRI